jgi:hypothetical protein
MAIFREVLIILLLNRISVMVEEIKMEVADKQPDVKTTRQESLYRGSSLWRPSLVVRLLDQPANIHPPTPIVALPNQSTRARLHPNRR